MLALRIRAAADPVDDDLGTGSHDSDTNFQRPRHHTSSSTSSSRRPKPYYCRGSIRLYRATAAKESSIIHELTSKNLLREPIDSQADSIALRLAYRGRCLLVLAVPSSFAPNNFRTFLDKFLIDITDILVIIRDDSEDSYSVVLQFRTNSDADIFYTEVNGSTINESGAVLRVLFLSAMDFQVSTKDISAPNDSRELPACPRCIDRLGQEINGTAADCDHRIPCSCILPQHGSCPVCNFITRKPTESHVCSICRTTENICICMICGVTGCGRSVKGHIQEHGKNFLHGYSLDLESKRVLDIMDGAVSCLYQSEFSSILEKDIGISNREFLWKLQRQRKVSVVQLTALDQETDAGLKNAVPRKRQMLSDKVDEMNKQTIEANKLYEALKKTKASLNDDLAMISVREAQMDNNIRKLEEEVEFQSSWSEVADLFGTSE